MPRELGRLIDPERALPALPPPLLAAHADTVYLTVVDRDRNVVSFINSLFESFGSGLVCPETGVLFHNRGKCFSLDPGHPNAIAPGKRPMHTIIPALAMRGRPAGDRVRRHGRPLPAGRPGPGADQSGRFRAGSAGGDRCAAQLRLRRRAADRAAACRRATAEALARRGHKVVPSGKPLGGGQMIMVDHERGVLLGGSDPRKDGLALGY